VPCFPPGSSSLGLATITLGTLANPAVDKLYSPVHSRGHAEIVGIRDDCLAAFAHDAFKDLETCSEAREDVSRSRLRGSTAKSVPGKRGTMAVQAATAAPATRWRIFCGWKKTQRLRKLKIQICVGGSTSLDCRRQSLAAFLCSLRCAI
jgi:hypothetical protein